MSIMHFMPKLTEFLRNNGTIYTMREYKYSTKEAMVPSIGKVKRTLINVFENINFDPSKLNDYVPLSGFNTTEEWIKVLNSFIRGRDVSIFLYKVEIVKGE